MKKHRIFQPSYLLWVAMVGISAMLAACQKEGGMDNEGTVSLSTIPENSSYANLPLVGTKWQLIGFANGKTGRIKKVELYQDNNYTLIFEETGKMSGFTTANVAHGEYELFENSPSKISISSFGPLTNVGELNDDELWQYLEKMNSKVNQFNITSRGLSLYHDLDNYLLFRPLLD